MRAHFLRVILLTSFVLCVGLAPTFAQTHKINEFITAGSEDASLLTREYLRPFATGFGTGLNAGFTETAKPKKVLGFSVQLRTSLSSVPTNNQSFDIADLDLQKLQLSGSGNSITPTVVGNKGSGPTLDIVESGHKIGEFKMPGGTGFAYVPAPMVQASVGLIKSTDITARFVPKVSMGSYGDFSLIGGAVKHGINQYIPNGKLIPLDITVMVGFNSINLDANLDLQPESGAQRDNNDPSKSSISNPNFDKQLATTKVNTFVANVLVGKTLPLVAVYGGVGFQNSTFKIDVEGDFPVPTYNPNQSGKTYSVAHNPFSFSINSESNVHALVGARLKFGLLAIFGEAMYTNYFTSNVGIGVSFR